MKTLIIATLLGIVSVGLTTGCIRDESPDTSEWITDGGEIKGFSYAVHNDTFNIVWIKEKGYYNYPRLVVTPHLDTLFINYNDL